MPPLLRPLLRSNQSEGCTKHYFTGHDSSWGLTCFSNVRATCVITILKAEFGWTQVGTDWCFDPTHIETDLKSIWRNDLPDCVQYDRNCLKDCFCNAATNPATAYVGTKANVLRNKLDHLEWPRDTTEFVSRFEPAGQYMIGPKFCSAYHLGDGFVGTAGHCLDKVLVDGQLGELRVVFNWVGDVRSKRTFTGSEIFGIERVVICDAHGPAPSPIDPVKTATWSRRWDTALFKMIGTPKKLSNLKSAKHATRAPCFGTPVYSIGCPLGTQLKVSVSAHVLRHSLVHDDTDPFSHKIAGYGCFTTDLDHFEGKAAFTHPILAYFFIQAIQAVRSLTQILASLSGISLQLRTLSRKATQTL